MTGVNGSGSSVATTRLWRLAILTAAGAIGTTTHAEAALYYWPDYSDGSYFYRQQPPIQRPRPHRRGTAPAKKEVVEKETGAKPQGPLVISVSIDRQKVTVYDSNGLFAEGPVSTGMKGHSTPMGVFSIIQKHKFHHSNIYSGAPMPYMQRITWSGVAMHAGVLPGYPASHGCIRMPMAFAMKMWNWTKMGARVIVAPGEMSPSSFSHPLLASFKVPPQPAASLAPDVEAPLGVKADKGAPETKLEIKSASADSVVELRSTVGHGVTMSDATTGNALAHDEAAAPADKTASAEDAAKPEAKSESAATADAADPAKPQPEQAAVSTDDAASLSESKPAETTSAEAKTAEAKTAEAKSAEVKPADTANVERNPAEAAEAAKASAEQPADRAEPVKVEPTVTEQAEAAKPEPAKAEPASSETATAEPAKPEAGAAKTPEMAVTATTPAAPAAPDAKKDQTRLAEPAPAAKPEPPKRAGQIAVFISRKDSKLYVRQNFAPLFEVPVTIAPSDRPLGTHVFTAEVDKNDSNALHWSVVSLPVSVRAAVRENESRSVHRHRGAAVIPVAAKPVLEPNSPAEALDRISVPADTMAKINEMLTTGGSIVVSDQGINQGETGEGTDFIVRLR